ncbi:MAG: hypothetical protein EXR77_18735 [Myxococcales bacterium]|nr:hypothetical protein [Myxococcales bacterium]
MTALAPRASVVVHVAPEGPAAQQLGVQATGQFMRGVADLRRFAAVAWLAAACGAPASRSATGDALEAACAVSIAADATPTPPLDGTADLGQAPETAELLAGDDQALRTGAETLPSEPLDAAPEATGVGDAWPAADDGNTADFVKEQPGDPDSAAGDAEATVEATPDSWTEAVAEGVADWQSGAELGADDGVDAALQPQDAPPTAGSDNGAGADGWQGDGAAIDAAPADVALCSAATESCDGIDNDCDGATDEGFTFQTPDNGPLLAVGQPCGGAKCGDGVVQCVNKTLASCPSCQTAVDLTAVLAPATAVPSPLKASGGFVEVSSKLPITDLKVDLAGPLVVPYGSSPMAIDTDNDGDLDVVWSDGVDQVVVWTQTAPWQFKAAQVLKLWTKPSSIAATDGPLGPTLLVGAEVLRALVRNGDGSYSDQTKALGLAEDSNGAQVQHVIPADLNDDGLLDIVVAQFQCGSANKGLRAWFNRGPGGYIKATPLLGLNQAASTWAVMQTDYDDDGLQDLLMLTETCAPDLGVGYYRHQSMDASGDAYVLKKQPPVFTAPGVPFASPMGGCSGDVNGDGVLDYLLTEIEISIVPQVGGDPAKIDPFDPAVFDSSGSEFLLSQPGGGRKLAGLQAGLWAPLSAGATTMTSWSPAFADLDHDGHLDVVISHGPDFAAWASAAAVAMRPVVLRNSGKQQFVDFSAAWGLPAEHDGRAMVLADLDGDGDDDLLLGGQGVQPRVLRNDLQHGGSDLTVRLKGATSNAWGLGARLTLQTNLRAIVAEHSVQAPSQTIQAPLSHFALQAGEAAQTLTVKWPSGWQQTVVAAAKGAMVVNEPLLSELSTRWSPAGTVPVTVLAYHLDASGAPVVPAQCTIELSADGQGQFSGPTVCLAQSCSRQWLGVGVPSGGSDAFVIACGGKQLQVRPRVFY